MKGWTNKFYDPILLPDDRKLTTLKQAGQYTIDLPKRESDAPEWIPGLPAQPRNDEQQKARPFGPGF